MLGDDVDRVALAGRFVAWVEAPPESSPAGNVVVYDRVSHTRAYTVANAQPVRDLALRADGTIVFAYRPDPEEHPFRTFVQTASPQAPARRRVGLPSRAFYFLRISGDRIGFLRAAPDSATSHRRSAPPTSRNTGCWSNPTWRSAASST